MHSAEQAKIALSSQQKHTIALENIADGLCVEVNKEILRRSNQRTLASIGDLMQRAINQALCQPEVIFVTGGSAKSPVLSDYIQTQLPNIPIIIGDHFGSVTSGLARWAETIYR